MDNLLRALLQRFLNDMHVPRKRGQVYSLLDLGELAARLGSPVTFDRRGDVAWIDDFAGGVSNWDWPTNQGAGKAVLSCGYLSRDGKGSALLCGGSQAGLETQEVERSTPYPAVFPAPKAGLSVGLTCDADAASFSLGLAATLDANTAWSFALRFRPSADSLELLDENGGWAVLASGLSGLALPHWNHAKLVVNPAEGAYERILFNEREIDCRAYGGQAVGASLPRRVRASISVTSQAGANGFLWLDHAILTYNE